MSSELVTSIKSEYDGFYRDLLGQGRLPLKDTKVGFWGAAITDEAFAALRKIGLTKSTTFLDLGSGDGKIALLAALLCKEAHGVEYDEELFKKSLEVAQKLGIGNVKFFNYDFFDHPLEGYDVVFIHPDKPMSRGVEQKLKNELQGKLVVYGHHFHPTSFKRRMKFNSGDTLVSVYGGKARKQRKR